MACTDNTTGARAGAAPTARGTGALRPLASGLVAARAQPAGAGPGAPPHAVHDWLGRASLAATAHYFRPPARVDSFFQ